MNTINSDNFIKKWTATQNPLLRMSFICQRDFSTTPDVLFPLLCPTTELDWLPQWTCELLHSKSGYTELDCIFKTTYFGADELWVCTRYELNEAIDYTRYAENLCTRLRILLIDKHDGNATGQWTVSVSALNDTGNMIIKQMEDARQHLEQAIDDLEYYVDNGELNPLERDK